MVATRNRTRTATQSEESLARTIRHKMGRKGRTARTKPEDRNQEEDDHEHMLQQASQEQLAPENSTIEEEEEEEVEEEKGEQEEEERAPLLVQPHQNCSCTLTAKGDDGDMKPSSGVRHYLVGFGKRVIICSLLVLICRTLWPHLQPVLWPDAPLKEGKLYVLTDRSFRGHISRGDHFVMMYAPWCGHCKNLKPTWEQLAKNPGAEGVKVGKVDCTVNQKLCKDYDVSGYPTLLYFRAGSKLEKYEGSKSLDALRGYVKKMAPPGVLPTSKTDTLKTKKKTTRKEL